MENIKLNNKQTARIRSLNKILEEINAKMESNKLNMEPFSLFCRVDNTQEGSVFVMMEDFEILLSSDVPNETIMKALDLAINNSKFKENFKLAIKGSYLEKDFMNDEEISSENVYKSLRRLFKIIANAILGGYTSKKNEMTNLAIEIAKSIASSYSDLLIFDNNMATCIEIIDRMKNAVINNSNITFSSEEKELIEKYLMTGENAKIIKKFYNYNKKLENNNDNDKIKLSGEEIQKQMVASYEKALNNIKEDSNKFRNLLVMYKKICNNINNSNLVKRSLYNYILSINENKNNKNVIKDFMVLFLDGNAKHPKFIQIIKPTLNLKSVDKTKFISELADKGDFDSVVEILSAYVELLKVGDLSSTVVKNVLDNLINCMDIVLGKTKTMVEDYDISIKNFEKFIRGIKHGNIINFVNEERFVKFNLNAPEELKDEVRKDITNMISYAYNQNYVIRRIKKGIPDDVTETDLPKKKKRRKNSSHSKTSEEISKPSIALDSKVNSSSKNVEISQANENVEEINEAKPSIPTKEKEELIQSNYVVCTPDEVTLELQKIKSTTKSIKTTKTWIVKSLKKDGYEKATKKLSSKIDEIIKNKKDYNDILLLLNYFLEVEWENARYESYYTNEEVTYYKDDLDEYINKLFELMCDCSDYIEEKTGVYYDGCAAKEILEKIEKNKNRK